jgi:hypothetical protein
MQRPELLCDLGQVRLLSNMGFGLGQLRQIGTYLMVSTSVCRSSVDAKGLQLV